MSSLPPTSAEDVIDQPARAQFEAFLDEHRSELNGCLDRLSEEQVAPIAGAFPDHIAGPGEARDLRREGLV